MDYCIRQAELPLAVYREVAAHLEQISGVRTELIPQQSQEFDYKLSQIDRLRIYHADDLDDASQSLLQQILDYYSDRYSQWEAVKDNS
jgi:hypothetical protein